MQQARLAPVEHRTCVRRHPDLLRPSTDQPILSRVLPAFAPIELEDFPICWCRAGCIPVRAFSGYAGLWALQVELALRDFLGILAVTGAYRE